MLALSWRLVARVTEPGWPMLRIWAWVGVAVLLAQVALGALVSASYAGLSCAAPGDCLRAAEAAGWPWQMLNPWREPVFGATPMPLNPSGALAQVVHRGGALLALLVLIPLGAAALRGQRRRDGAALLVLLVLQLGLGWLMVSMVLTASTGAGSQRRCRAAAGNRGAPSLSRDDPRRFYPGTIRPPNYSRGGYGGTRVRCTEIPRVAAAFQRFEPR